MLRSSVRQRGLQQLLLQHLRSVQTTAGASQAQPAQAPASDTIEVFVNDEPVNIPKGSTVLQACDAAGIDIPRWVTDARNSSSSRRCRCRRCGSAHRLSSSAACQESYHTLYLHVLLAPQVLLPPPFVNRWKLPHVPCGGAESTAEQDGAAQHDW